MPTVFAHLTHFFQSKNLILDEAGHTGLILGNSTLLTAVYYLKWKLSYTLANRDCNRDKTHIELKYLKQLKVVR